MRSISQDHEKYKHRLRQLAAEHMAKRGAIPPDYQSPESPNIIRQSHATLPAAISQNGNRITWSCPYCDKRHRGRALPEDCHVGAIVIRAQRCRAWRDMFGARNALAANVEGFESDPWDHVQYLRVVDDGRG